MVTHQGRHYLVDNARLYTLPERPPEVHVSAFGPEALSVAARIGDGLITMMPDADFLAQYDEQGGRGPKAAGLKGCWAADESDALRTAMRGANEALPGQLAQELSMPSQYEDAITLVTEEMIADEMPLGSDPERWSPRSPSMARQVSWLHARDTLAISEDLRTLDVPARVVWGAADQFQKIAYGQRLAWDLDADLDRIAGGRHFRPGGPPRPHRRRDPGCRRAAS